MSHVFNSADKISSINVIKLILQKSGTYNDQWVRPYTTNGITAMVLNSVVDRFSTSVGRVSVAASEISDISGEIVRPSAVPEKHAIITNGWSTQRIRFLLVVQASYITGGNMQYFISGYTDFYGLSNSNYIAPDMVFYVNSITTARERSIPTAYGNKTIMMPTDSVHVHTSQDWNALSQPGNMHLMRPMDVYNTMGVAATMQGQLFDKGSYDARNIVQGNAKLSQRTNSLPSNYASRVIGAKLGALSSAGYSADSESVYNTSAGNVRENDGYTNPFLRAIAGVVGTQTTGSTFTFGNLVELDPNTHNVTNFAALDGSVQVHQAGMGTADWGAADVSTVAASVLAHSVPALMSRVGLTRLAFDSTNHTVGGMMHTIITSANALGSDGSDIPKRSEVFRQCFEIEVLRDITYNNQESYRVAMVVDLLGETWIKVQVGHQPMYEYVAPSFCDGLFTPVLTSNKQLVKTVSSDFDSMVDKIHEAVNEKHPTIFGAQSQDLYAGNF